MTKEARGRLALGAAALALTGLLLLMWLGADASAAAPEPTPVPTIAPGGQPWFILVNTSAQVASVYAADAEGHYTRLLKQFPCSAGRRDGYTPKALYTLNGAHTRWMRFSDWGGDYGQYATRIWGPFLFHSVGFLKKDESTLEVDTYLALTQPASHGCIRLLPEDAKWIYDNCPKNTYVEVRLGEQDPELSQRLQPPPPIDGKYLATMPPQIGERPVPAADPNWKLKGKKIPYHKTPPPSGK